MPSTVIVRIRRFEASEYQAKCGDKITFGAVAIGSSCGGGSTASTSSPAPAILPEQSASLSAT